MIILSGKTKVGIRKFLRNLTYTQKFQISAFFMFSAFLLSMVYFYFLSLHSTILTIEFILEFLLFASMLFMMFGFLSFLLFKQATIELGAEPSEIRDVITRYLKGHALINDKKYFQNSTGLFKNLLEAAEFVNQTKFNLKQEIEKQSNIINNQNKQIILQSRTAIMGEMIGNIAHQWRQPLNTIGLYLTDAKLNIMNDGNLTADNSDMLVNDIQEQIIYLSKTIDDFLNFFKPNK